MKRIVVYIALIAIAFGCAEQQNVDMYSFREGSFEIPAGDKYDKTTFVRNGNYQIETYGERIDSLEIIWTDNFNYTLKMLHPKSELDQDPIKVRITKVTANSYDFEAVIGHSNYKQIGTVIKLTD
ncbi:hypothetical protein KH5_24050 [Urechidicola sp. KH5]